MEIDSVSKPEEVNPDFHNRYLGLLSSVENLPTLSTLLWELQAVLRSPFSDSATVALVIEKDPSLTAHVLRYANSAAAGTRERILSVQEAVARVGLDRIEELATGMLILDAFSGVGISLDPQTFWKHCFRVASITHSVCMYNPNCCSFMPEEVFIAGLLHDVGKLILDQYFHNEFVCISITMTEDECSSFEAEEKVIGLNHGDVGADLLQCWGFPDDLVVAIRHHHKDDPDSHDKPLIAEMVGFADVIAHVIHDEPVSEIVFSHPEFTFTPQQFEDIKEKLAEEEEYVNNILSL